MLWTTAGIVSLLCLAVLARWGWQLWQREEGEHIRIVRDSAGEVIGGVDTRLTRKIP